MSINTDDFLIEIYNRIPNKKGKTDTYSYTFYLGEDWCGSDRYPKIVYKRDFFLDNEKVPFYKRYNSIRFQYLEDVLEDKENTRIPCIDYRVQSGFDPIVDNILQELCREKNIPLIRPIKAGPSIRKYIQPQNIKLAHFYDNLFKGYIDPSGMIDLNLVSKGEVTRAKEIAYKKYINTSEVVSTMESLFEKRIEELGFLSSYVDYKNNVLQLKTPRFLSLDYKFINPNFKDIQGVKLLCQALVKASIEMANILKIKKIEVFYNYEVDYGGYDPRNCKPSYFGKLMGEVLKSYEFHLYTNKDWQYSTYKSYKAMKVI